MDLWFNGSQCVPTQLFPRLKPLVSGRFMTDLACRGLVAVARSSGGRSWRRGTGCWGGKPGSSRRACSPAGTRQDKYSLHEKVLPHLQAELHICDHSPHPRCWSGYVGTRGGLERSWPGSAAVARWSCAAAGSAAAAAWRSETQDMHRVCMWQTDTVHAV